MLEKLENLEEKIIFNFTRIIALIMILGMFILLVIGIIGLTTMKDNTYVSYSTVKTSLTTSNDSSGDTSQTPSREESLEAVTSGVYIPQEVKDKFQGENRDVLIGWLKNMNTQQQEKFVSNLSNIINEAESDESINLYTAVNKYKSLKFNKFTQQTSNPLSSYEDTARKIGIALFVTIAIGLIGLFSLVLVLLAIERNTRSEDKLNNTE